jgi:hypothetical protein
MYYINYQLTINKIVIILDLNHNLFKVKIKCKILFYYFYRVGWIDISNLLSKVPLISGNIFVKILQLPGDH